jgi:hypothetical protein
VSPLRWITMKITLIFAALVAAALAIGLLATWTIDPLTPAFGGRYNSTLYDVQGAVAVACMLFALSPARLRAQDSRPRVPRCTQLS